MNWPLWIEPVAHWNTWQSAARAEWSVIDGMACEPTEGPGLKYRLMLYLFGTVFSMASYCVVMWAYAAESAALEQTASPHFWQQIASIQLQHPFTFIAWVVVMTTICAAVGYLFDREVYFRHAAEMKSTTDSLTGCYTHRYLQERLAVEIERAQRYQRPLTIAMFDLDDFKIFNDRYGHEKGDQLLRQFTDLCRSNIRMIDILTRYGGEEFVVILPEATTAEAESACNRIREAFQAEAALRFPNAPMVTVSVGIASYPEHGQTRHALILNSDAALCHAKQTGKNKTAVFEDDCKKSYRATSEKLQTLLEDNHMEAIEALSAAVDAKDHYTRGHSDSVTRYSLALAKKLGLSESELENLKAAALLHDIGKIGTPDSILRKPGPLKIDEWQIIEDHPRIGSEILEKVQQLSSIVPAVRHHHERYDGLGYPNGLVGRNIPLIARIIALADSYDAMTSDRTYRRALSPEEALEEMRRCAGTQFDPELVEIFIEIVKDTLLEEKREAA
jgi:diguanylate cyclase (GGDEF)-like protein/putative nucleotidyltransferase with HDIG domain